jgi:hypothetical protein
VSAHSAVFDMKNKASRAGGKPNPYVDRAGYKQFIAASEKRFREFLAKGGS